MAAAVAAAAVLGGGLLLAAWRWLRPAARPGAGSGASMRGKTVIITGANSGLGRAVAAELLRMKARVIMGCRDRARAERAASEIRAELGEREAAEGGGELVVRQLDLASLSSVRDFCRQVLQVRALPGVEGFKGSLPLSPTCPHSARGCGVVSISGTRCAGCSKLKGRGRSSSAMNKGGESWGCAAWRREGSGVTLLQLFRT